MTTINYRDFPEVDFPYDEAVSLDENIKRLLTEKYDPEFVEHRYNGMEIEDGKIVVYIDCDTAIFKQAIVSYIIGVWLEDNWQDICKNPQIKFLDFEIRRN